MRVTLYQYANHQVLRYIRERHQPFGAPTEPPDKCLAGECVRLIPIGYCFSSPARRQSVAVARGLDNSLDDPSSFTYYVQVVEINTRSNV